MLDENCLNTFGGYDALDFYSKLLQLDYGPIDDLNYSKYVVTSANFPLGRDVDLGILCLNIQSLYAKLTKFRVLLELLRRKSWNPKIICLQEARVDDSTIDLFHLDGYVTYYCPPKCSSSTGLLTYVHNSISSRQLDISSSNDLWEILCVECKNAKGSKIVISNIYRQGNFGVTDLDAFFDDFINVLEVLNSLNQNIILMGDFNFNLLHILDKVYLKIYLESLLSEGYLPNISHPTRIWDSATLIDHVFYKCRNNSISLKSFIMLDRTSDHLPLMTFVSNFLEDCSNCPHGKMLNIEIILIKIGSNSERKLITSHQNSS